jgi:hypothetical protein
MADLFRLVKYYGLYPDVCKSSTATNLVSLAGWGGDVKYVTYSWSLRGAKTEPPGFTILNGLVEWKIYKKNMVLTIFYMVFSGKNMFP